MILGLLGVSWAIVENVCTELMAWEGLGSKNKSIRLISLTIFWVIWEERNNRTFDGIESDFNKVKDNWFHYFGSNLLGHKLDCLDDLVDIVDILTEL